MIPGGVRRCSTEAPLSAGRTEQGVITQACVWTVHTALQRCIPTGDRAHQGRLRSRGCSQTSVQAQQAAGDRTFLLWSLVRVQTLGRTLPSERLS